jgi:hypothetical protein
MLPGTDPVHHFSRWLAMDDAAQPTSPNAN